MSEEMKPTLTDAKGSGGLVAQSGFDYQLWEALARLPRWLLQPTFESFILEGLEDIEARFFTPYAPESHVIDRFQAKRGSLTKSGITEVLSSFLKYDQSYPGTAHVQTLVTPSLPASLQWITRDQTRIQKARPFYKPFATVTSTSDLKLRDDLIKEFGEVLGDFTVNNVDFALHQYTDIQAARLAFAQALEVAFPTLDCTQKQVRAAFDDLVTLANEYRGTEITRDQTIQVLRTALDAPTLIDDPLQVHIRSDRDPEQLQAIEIDASAFAGGEVGFPEASEWSALTIPLQKVASWAHQGGHHRIQLTGSYRLSTAFAIGAAFRAARGFDLDFQVRGGWWRTDDHSHQDGESLGWQTQQATGLVDEHLVIAIGVLRSPLQEVMKTLRIRDQHEIMHLQLEQAITSSQELQTAVNYIKKQVVQAVSTHRPKALHVFFVGPATLALALGHRWNALPPVQWYEFQAKSGIYQPTCWVE
ncbi:SAVED domain-containing protein [Deinococcus sp. VB343]|uniref:SAVED domain-containing protein n=1 Tax=Deinococcus sp. VB343 TaxID=3385567 RepID=UPI0039C9B593